MHVHRIYPERTPRNFFRRNRQEITRSLFIACGYICLLLNILLGGTPWSLIAIGGLCVAWVAFIYRPLVENTLIKKLSDISIAVCLYLFLLGAVLRQSWSGFVVSIVFFGELFVIGFIYLAFFKKQKRNFMPLFEFVMVGLAAILVELVSQRRLDWPSIVAGGAGISLMALGMALFPKEIMIEWKKRMHR